MDATDATSEKKSTQPCSDCDPFRCLGKANSLRQQARSHVTHKFPWCWYSYLHNWVFFRENVGKYSSTMEHMGHIPSLFTNKDVDNPPLIEVLPTRHKTTTLRIWKWGLPHYQFPSLTLWLFNGQLWKMDEHGITWPICRWSTFENR